MIKTKRIGAFLLISLMIAAMCLGPAACNNQTPYDPNNFIQDTTNPKIVNEKVTIRLFAPKHALHISDFNEMVLFKEMEARTNIHIEWMYGNASNYEQDRVNAWNSRNRPDAFFLWNSQAEQIRYSASGGIAPLDDLINEWAPNYKALMDLHPEMAKAAKLSDGKMYSTVLINDVPRDQTFKQFINWEILNYYYGKMPETTGEFYDALKAIKSARADLIPLSAYSLHQTRNFLMSAFGYVSTGMELSGDTVVYVPETNNYREYLSYTRKLYAEKLLDNSTYEMTKESDLAAKGSSVVCFDTAAAYLIAGVENDAKFKALPPLTSPINSQKMWLSFDNTFTPNGLIINNQSVYKREIIRWMDALYSADMREMQAFGKEGLNWDWDDAEKTSFTFKVPEGENPETYRGSITPGVGLGVVAYWDKNFVLKEADALTGHINQCVEEAGYLNYLKVPYPQVKMTKEETNEIAIIQTDLNMYMTGFEQDAVTGKIALNDSTWATHLSNLNKIGIATAKSVHQSAYNRYKTL